MNIVYNEIYYDTKYTNDKVHPDRPYISLKTFNVSFEDSIFPRTWAKGFINILPKGGNLKDPSNWRPITQALLPAKMLEKLVQKRLFDILQSLNYISGSQYGFMSGRSTQEAVLKY